MTVGLIFRGAKLLVAAGALAMFGTAGAEAAAKTERLVIVGATVIDGTGREPLRDSVIFVADGKIERIGSRAELTPPEGATIIDARGKFVVPGLVDSHTHVDSLGVVPMTDAQKELAKAYLPRAFLYNGVTTVLNMSAHVPAEVLAMRDRARSDPSALLPRIYTGAAHFTAEGGWGGRHGGGVQSPADVGRRLDEYSAMNVDLVKVILEDGLGHEEVFAPLSQEHVRSVVEQSRTRRLPVFIHATDEEEYRRAIDVGPRAIVHGLFAPVQHMDQIVAGLKEKQIFVVPTAVLFESFHRFLEEPAALDDIHLAASVPDFVLSGVRDPRMMADIRSRMDSILKMDSAAWARSSMAGLKENIRRFARSGVKLGTGTDSGGAVPHAFHGYNSPRELEILAECCLSAMDTIVAATRTGSEIIGASSLFGTLEPGKSADLLILNADPLTDMKNIRNFDRMLLRGRLVERATLSYRSFLAERGAAK